MSTEASSRKQNECDEIGVSSGESRNTKSYAGKSFC